MLQKGQSILWQAAFYDHTDIALHLLEHGAEVDLPTDDVRQSNTMYTLVLYPFIARSL